MTIRPDEDRRGIETSIHGELLGADEYELHPVQAILDLAAPRGPAGGPDESHVNQSLSAGALRCDGNRVASVARSRGQRWHASQRRRPSEVRVGRAFGRALSIGPVHQSRSDAEHLRTSEPADAGLHDRAFGAHGSHAAQRAGRLQHPAAHRHPVRRRDRSQHREQRHDLPREPR